MSEFVFQNKKIRINLTYDGIKLYPNLDEEKTTPKLIRKTFEQAIEKGLISEDQARVARDDSHYYLKFNSKLTRSQLREFLNLAVQSKLLDGHEKKQCLADYDARYADARQGLTLLRGNDKEADTKKIIHFISACKDNDILAEAHQHLVSSQFDYLRKFTGLIHKSLWRGTNNKGEVVETTHSWAKIEKAIALQMAKNIQEGRGAKRHFTKEQDEAFKLGKEHKFLSIKRNAISLFRSANESYEAFLFRDEKTLAQKYDSHFKSSLTLR